VARKKVYHHEKKYRKTKRGHISRLKDSAAHRARDEGLDFNLDLDYLELIATDFCPVFGTPFNWGQGEKVSDWSPSLDKIVPEFGYIKHNVVWISMLANKIKQNVTENELYLVGDWLHEERKKTLDALKRTAPPIPIEHVVISKANSPYRLVFGTRTWEDSYGADYHPGEQTWEDLGSCTQESGGNSMVRGVWEMGTLKISYGGKSYGYTNTTGIGVEELQRLIYCKLRELGLVIGAKSKVRLSSDRRKQSLQGSIDQEIQSPQEAFEGF
jgi:hypothetical protein